MKYLLVTFSLLAVLSCKKSGAVMNSIDCDALIQAIASKNVMMVQQELGDLLNQAYSNANLEVLAADISSNCDITATLECFDCIKTNPAQSEMSASFVVGDPVRQFVLDLAPSATNTIKVISIN